MSTLQEKPNRFQKPQVPVSVIIPHYNRSERIADALESVARQLVKPLEIIIVDDCSEPSHRIRLQRYADVAIILEQQANGGPAAARNAGLKAAKGEYVAFLDDDDTWAPERLKVQLQSLDEDPALDGVSSAVIVREENGTEWIMSGHSPEMMTLSAALEATPALLQTLLIRARVIHHIGGLDHQLRQFEDQDFFIRLMKSGYKIRHLPTPLTVWCWKGTSRLTQDWRGHLSGELQVIRKHRELYNETFGAGGARRHLAKAIQRAGIRRGRFQGRALYAAGCILAADIGRLALLAATGRMSAISYSNERLD